MSRIVSLGLKRARIEVAREAVKEKAMKGDSERYNRMLFIVGLLSELIGD